MDLKIFENIHNETGLSYREISGTGVRSRRNFLAHVGIVDPGLRRGVPVDKLDVVEVFEFDAG